MNRFFLGISVSVVFTLAGCSSSSTTQTANNVVSVAALCSSVSTSSPVLDHYDSLSEKYLDPQSARSTIIPQTNYAGNVVWNTRYYLESLLTAYEATQNKKYLTEFVTTGNAVMSLMTTIVVADAPAPINPADVANAPKISVTGFTTLLASFGVATPIPTASGNGISMYVQNLQPTTPTAAAFLRIDPLPGGGVLVSWLNTSELEMESYTISNMRDLEGLATLPLTESTSLGRFEITGQGMPKPGVYENNTAQPTIWIEQTGGILLPFARFLLLAKEDPSIADPSTIATWTANLKAVADSDEAVALVSDGAGGLLLHNPQWTPNPLADVNAPMDYVAAETTFRLVYYEFSGDSHQLDLARGLLLHQEKLNWTISDRGWFLLKDWPDFLGWSKRADAPKGSIWTSFENDPKDPAATTDGGFNAELLATARKYGLVADLGIAEDIYTADQNTLLQYLFISDSKLAVVRGDYPGSNSTPTDHENPSSDPYASSSFLTPEVTNDNFVSSNWNWMIKYGTETNNTSLGYFLRAWARSEAAERAVCKSH